MNNYMFTFITDYKLTASKLPITYQFQIYEPFVDAHLTQQFQLFPVNASLKDVLGLRRMAS